MIVSVCMWYISQVLYLWKHYYCDYGYCDYYTYCLILRGKSISIVVFFVCNVNEELMFCNNLTYHVSFFSPLLSECVLCKSREVHEMFNLFYSVHGQMVISFVVVRINLFICNTKLNSVVDFLCFLFYYDHTSTLFLFWLTTCFDQIKQLLFTYIGYYHKMLKITSKRMSLLNEWGKWSFLCLLIVI